MENKVLGLDGKIYTEVTPETVVTPKTKKPIKTGTIMDAVELETNHVDMTSDNSSTMEEMNNQTKLSPENIRRLMELQNRKPIIRKNAKIGRNEKCPCGSGLKYKNCCWSSGKYEETERKK